MADILKIYHNNDPILRTKCREIAAIEPWVLQLADNMWLTMLMARAVGLAANQVGMDYRLITVRGQQYEGPMINPVIEAKSEELYHFEEGCLSMPGYFFDTGKRSKYIRVSFLDLEGNKQTVDLSEDTAVIVQHEVDHLDGIFFTDHLHEKMYGR